MVDPETLPDITTTFSDVLFYSHGALKEAAPGHPGPGSITFFAFSLIKGCLNHHRCEDSEEIPQALPTDQLLGRAVEGDVHQRTALEFL